MTKSALLEALTPEITHSPGTHFALLTNILATWFNSGAVEREPLK